MTKKLKIISSISSRLFWCELLCFGDISPRDVCLLSNIIEVGTQGSKNQKNTFEKLISSVSFHKSSPGYSRQSTLLWAVEYMVYFLATELHSQPCNHAGGIVNLLMDERLAIWANEASSDENSLNAYTPCCCEYESLVHFILI